MVNDLGNVSKGQSRPNISAVGAAACFRDPWAFLLHIVFFFFLIPLLGNLQLVVPIQSLVYSLCSSASQKRWVYNDTTGEPRVLFCEAPFVKFMNQGQRERVTEEQTSFVAHQNGDMRRGRGPLMVNNFLFSLQDKDERMRQIFLAAELCRV